MASPPERPYSTVSQPDSLMKAIYTPLPLTDGPTSLDRPQPPFIALEGTETPRDSIVPSTPTDSQTFLPANQQGEAAYDDGEKAIPLASPPPSTKPRRSKFFFALVGLLVLAIVIVAVIIPVYFTVIKPRSNRSSNSASTANKGDGNSDGGATPTSTGAGGKTTPISAESITGGDGSTVVTSDGSKFTYQNNFGGICELSFVLIFCFHGRPFSDVLCGH